MASYEKESTDAFVFRHSNQISQHSNLLSVCNNLLHVLPFYLMLFVCVKAFADTVSSQKRAAADGECREESLLQETATKEAAMATRMEEVQADLKQARLALSNAHAEIDRLGVCSAQLKKVW